MKNHTLVLIVLVLTMASLSHSAMAAILLFDGTASADWADADNWSIYPGPVELGSTPWDYPTSPADDVSIGTPNMIVNTTETYTTGPNAGTAFMLRRIAMQGGRTLTIQTGGTLNFSGAADSKLDLTNTGSTLIMTGGSLICTQSNLNGVNLTGSNALFSISGSSTVSISEVGSDNPGVSFGVVDVARTMHISGSDASISLEKIGFGTSSDHATNAELKFTLDAGGASAVNVTEVFDMTYADSLTLSLENPGGVFSGSSVLLFDLANGSTDTFDSVVTSAGTYSGAEGTEIQLEVGGPTYTLTYDMNGNGDIGLVPEPATISLLALGGIVTLCRRRRK